MIDTLVTGMKRAENELSVIKLFHTFLGEMKSNLHNHMGFTNETLNVKYTMRDISKLFRECDEGGGRE